MKRERFSDLESKFEAAHEGKKAYLDLICCTVSYKGYKLIVRYDDEKKLYWGYVDSFRKTIEFVDKKLVRMIKNALKEMETL